MSQNFSYLPLPAKNNPISTVHHSAQDDMMQGNANKKNEPHSWKLSLLHPRMEDDQLHNFYLIKSSDNLGNRNYIKVYTHKQYYGKITTIQSHSVKLKYTDNPQTLC